MSIAAGPTVRRLAIDVGRGLRADPVAGVATVICLGLLAVFVVIPVLLVLRYSIASPAGLTLDTYHTFLGEFRYYRALVNSLWISLVSTGITVAIALVLAFATARARIPGRNFFYTATLIPLIAPPFVVSLALILLLGRRGLITYQLLDLNFNIYGPIGIILAEVFSNIPRAFLILYGVLLASNPELEEAAQSLGARGSTVLRRVTLPMIKPGIVSAGLLVFIDVMTDFGNPMLIGAGYPVLATEIFIQIVGLQDFPMAATMSTFLIVPCLVAFLINQRLIGSKSYVMVGGRAASRHKPPSPAARWALLAFCAAVAFCIIAVYLSIVVGAFVQVWGVNYAFTTRHFQFLTVGGASVVWNSLKVSLAAGVLGAMISILIAYLVERKRPPGRQVLQFTALLPAGLPGSVMGVGYILAFNTPPLELVNTIYVLIFSILFGNLSVGVMVGISVLKQIDPSMEEAAASLGAGPVATFFRVMAGFLRMSFLSALIYIFIRGMVTLSAVIFLVFPGFNLASVSILNQVEAGRLGTAAALSTILLGIVLAATVVMKLVVDRRRAPAALP